MQKEIFAAGEGDSWFQRNRAALQAEDRMEKDPILHMMAANAVVPSRVLEVGASNGFRLHEISRLHGSEVHGLELSSAAIDDGRTRYPEVKFHHGSAEKLPLADSSVDCVVVNAVLHWLDRGDLMRAVSEIDRVLADGGLFLLGDFSPPYPQKVRYHHRSDADIYTYKQQYHRIFLAGGNYALAAFQLFDHDTMKPDPTAAGDHAYGVAILRKNLGVTYALRELQKGR